MLGDNDVTTVYIRYFDIDFEPGSIEPKPLAPVRLNMSTKPFRIVPVVYVKNRVFQQLDSGGIAELAKDVFSLISKINIDHHIVNDEVQFDCDWTETTRDNYFHFIRKYRAISKVAISATIRLHQVKYHQITGMPPADKGVLMYYNMGTIDAGENVSIYDKSIAARYNSYIRSYPMVLDIALPIFLWGLQTRDGKVIQLLNKMNFSHFENDTNFIRLKKNFFSAKHGCFKGGYYFRQSDVIKIENVSSEELREIAGELSKYSKNQIRNLIFYDLDSVNLVHYDKDIFKEILYRID
jgi:hypothetical protein